jgi:xanthine dehydrogenase molybdopterin-binding subunit B
LWESSFDVEQALAEPVKMVSGVVTVGTQHHFHMEQHTTLAHPLEDGQLELWSATQWIAHTQEVVANALGINMHAIDMKVKKWHGGTLALLGGIKYFIALEHEQNDFITLKHE